LFAAVARTMEMHGRSDSGARLPGWLVEAGFGSVDPGERRFHYSADGVLRQVPYVAGVVESTLGTLLDAGGTSEQLEAGLAELKALSRTPDAALGWIIHKATAVN
jgi:hypothetical protein